MFHGMHSDEGFGWRMESCRASRIRASRRAFFLHEDAINIQTDCVSSSPAGSLSATSKYDLYRSVALYLLCNIHVESPCEPESHIIASAELPGSL